MFYKVRYGSLRMTHDLRFTNHGSPLYKPELINKYRSCVLKSSKLIRADMLERSVIEVYDSNYVFTHEESITELHRDCLLVARIVSSDAIATNRVNLLNLLEGTLLGDLRYFVAANWTEVGRADIFSGRKSNLRNYLENNKGVLTAIDDSPFNVDEHFFRFLVVKEEDAIILKLLFCNECNVEIFDMKERKWLT